jgi:diguanylate cyclase (GGDEF)-like protein
VLEEVARRISGEIRSSDVVGRLGGDEFVVLLSAADWDSAKDVCRRLVETVNALPVTLPSGQELTVAISCGVAPYRPGTSAERFLHEADVALYAAKRAGRNQMVAA